MARRHRLFGKTCRAVFHGMRLSMRATGWSLVLLLILAATFWQG